MITEMATRTLIVRLVCKYSHVRGYVKWCNAYRYQRESVSHRLVAMVRL